MEKYATTYKMTSVDTHSQEEKITTLLAGLNTTREGLSSQEAHRRLKIYGLNVISNKYDFSLIQAFAQKVTNPLILILLGASCISALTRAFGDFVIILTIVLVSIVIEVLQEYQSNNAAKKLRQKVATKAAVLRDSVKTEIDVSHLTAGDIVFLEIGDIVPADLTLIASKDCHVDESVMTGESLPVEKQVADTLLMGTTVSNGEAIAVVQKTGKETQYGQIGEQLEKGKTPTDFEKGIRQFGILTMRLTLLLVFFIFAVNIVFHHDFFTTLLFALALAVGLTPELLPMITTLNLAKGAARMAHKGVIVKHLPAIQNLGSMNVLCTDKTGTITENSIVLERYENVYGEMDTRVLHFAFINSFFQSNRKGPMDQAVLKHTEVSTDGYEKIDEIPFDFERKRMSVIVRDAAHKELLVTKGAHEGIIVVCTHRDDRGKSVLMDKKTKDALMERFTALGKEGFRVLSIAYKEVPNTSHQWKANSEEGLTFLGFTAFLDPPKKDVKEILRTLADDGINLKILTGDNEFVTERICQELGLSIEGIVIGGNLLTLDDNALTDKVTHANIFARLVPQEKKRIIACLQKAGFVVGYLGDGINDATSLRQADVGISVNNAVDVAKESADLILVTKSLHVLADGIVEGRKTFANTLKYIFMGMGSNLGNMVSMSIASLVIPFLPMLPIQILLNNLIYDFSQIALPTDNVDASDTVKPQQWNLAFIKKFIITFAPISSAFDIITFGALLYFFHASIPFFRTAWFVESIVTQSLIILSVRTKRVPFWRSKPSMWIVCMSLGASFLGIAISQSPIGSLFSFTKLPPLYWVFLAIVILSYFAMVEIAKKWFYGEKSRGT